VSVLVRCRGVVCRLGGQTVLDRLDFELQSGEAVALLGPSGCGKSTLLRVVAGLEVPEQGEVLVEGRPATRDGRLLVPPHRRSLALLFQDLALWPNLTVAENVRLGLSGLRLSAAERRRRVDQALRLCEIAELADRRPGTLSGGQQQRVALARALAVRPKLLLLDEPFGGLDPLTKQSLLQQVARLRSELGWALVLVTHDSFEAVELCDELAVLDGGRIVERVSLRQSAERVRTPLAKAFLHTLSAGRSG